MKKSHCASFLLAAAACLLLVCPGESQSQWGATPETKNITQLRQAMPLPGIPEYPRSQFVVGYVTPTATGSGYSESFHCSDPPAVIIEWYAGALPASGWTTVNKSGHSLYCKQNLNTCQVNVIQTVLNKKRVSTLNLSCFVSSRKH
ncbi:MAG: hypothetical protein ACRD3W_07765 [Terriglobales bacterium]